MPHFVAPQPPYTAVMPHTTQIVLLWLMSAFAVVGVAWSIRDAYRHHDLVPIYALIGAFIAILYEPLGDSLVMAFYPTVHQHVWFTAFGREVPTFIGILYFWYMAPFVVLFARHAHKGFTAKQWWTMWVGTLCFCAGFEMFWMAMGRPWLYYGDQAFVIARLPLFVPFTYVSFVVAMCAGVSAIMQKFPKRHQWLIIPGLPACLAAGHAVTSLPGAAALYSTHNKTLIAAGSIGSIVLAILLAWVLGQCFRRTPETSETPAGRPAAEPPVTRPAEQLVGTGV